MELDVASDRQPTHLEGLHDDNRGVVDCPNSIVLPILIVPYLLQAAGNPPAASMRSEDVSIFGSKFLYSSEESAQCDICGDELDMNLFLDNPEAATDPEEVSFVTITANDAHSTPLSVDPKCLREMQSELERIVDEYPEQVAAASI